MRVVFKLASCIVRDGALGIEDAVGWTVRLAATLEIIHRVGAAHGRVSPKAIQVLGTSYNAGGFMLDTPDLTDDFAYHSLERLDGGQPSPEDDTWATAVLLYECLTGELPYAGTTAPEVMAHILSSARAPLADYGFANPRLQLVLDEALRRERDQRISSISVLKERLVACVTDYDDLPPLKLGKPDMSFFEESTDDDGEKLTAVIDVPPAVLAARLQHAEKTVARRRAEAVAEPLHEAEPAATVVMADPEQLGSGRPHPDPDSVDTRQVRKSPEIIAAVETAAARYEAELAGRPAPGESSDEVSPVPSSRWPDLGVAGPTAALPALSAADSDWEDGSDRSGARPTSPRPTELRASPSSSGEIAVARAVARSGPSSSGQVIVAPAELRSGPSSSGPVVAVDPRSGPGASGPLPPAPAVPPPQGRRPRSTWARDFFMSLLFLGAGGVAAYYLYGDNPWAEGGGSPSAAAPSAQSTPPPLAPTSTVAASAAADPTTLPTAAATASTAATADPAAAASTAAPSGDIQACMLPLFPKDTFAFTKTYFDFVCSETDARKGGTSLRIQVIRSGGGRRGVTAGMREWARLGWYEMAAFAIARRHCCADAAPIHTAAALERCPLDESLQILAAAVATGSDEDVNEALQGYTKVVHCTVRAGASRSFSQRGLPGGSALRVLRRTIERARKPSVSP